MADEFETKINTNNEVNCDDQNYNQELKKPGITTIPQHKYVTYIPYGMTPKTFEEKKAIKRSAKMIGISFLIMLGLSEIWSYIYFYVMQKNGFTYQKALELISNPAITECLQIVLSSIFFIVPFSIVFKLFGNRISDLIQFDKPKKGMALPLFLFGISFCFFSRISSAQAKSIFEKIGVNYEVNFSESPTGFFGFIICLISTAIVPALIEEFALRGLVLGSLRKYGESFAVIVSSIIFGLMHSNFEQIPLAFFSGLVLGYIVVKTNSIWISMALHALNNFISIFFEFFLCNFSTVVQNIIYIFFMMIGILAGIISLIIFSSDSSSYYYFNKSDTESTEKQKFNWFFSSVFIIIFVAVVLIKSFSYFVI